MWNAVDGIVAGFGIGVAGGGIQAAETMGVGIIEAGRKVGETIAQPFDRKTEDLREENSLSLWRRSDSSSRLSHCTVRR